MISKEWSGLLLRRDDVANKTGDGEILYTQIPPLGIPLTFPTTTRVHVHTSLLCPRRLPTAHTDR